MILNYLQSEMGRALTRTFIARATTTLGAILLLAVVGQQYGPAGAGVLALAQSLLLGAGILAKHGMDHTLMRFVGQDHNSPHALGYLAWACRKSLALAILAAITLLIFRSWLETGFDTPGLSIVTIGIALAAPAFTFNLVLAGFFKGIRKPATACLLENGAVALIAAGLLIIGTSWHRQSDLSLIGLALAIAAWLVALQGSVSLWHWARQQTWWRQIAKETATHPIPKAQLNNTSKAFFIQSLAGFMQQVLSIMIAGWMLNSAELGLFKASQQLGMLIAFILVVINAILPPQFAALKHQGDLAGLNQLARQGAIIGTSLALPLMLICLIVPTWPLGWFGPGFEQAAPLLRIIAFAQLVNVATGSVGFLLSMTGHERLIRNIALCCNGLGLLGFFIFIGIWGALGAALALAFILLSQNLTALYFVWRKLGIWTAPTPNFLLWVKIRPEVVNSTKDH